MTLTPRLLLFVTDLEVGGTPFVVRELAKRLGGRDLAVEVACLGRFGPVAEAIRADGGAVTAMNLRPWQLPFAVSKLRRLVRERRFDTVFSFLVHANVVAALALRREDNVRRVQSIQTTQPYPRWHWTAQRWAAAAAQGIIVPSQSIAHVAQQRSAIDPSRVTVIPNAVGAAEVVAALRSPRDRASPLRVGFLGRLDPIKNVPDLVEAVLPLDRVELHIFGDGPDRARVEAASEGSPKVMLHGFVDRREALLSIDVLCLASSAEGMPMVLIEAMAAGVPVIGTNVPGIRDVIEHNRTGWLAGYNGRDPAKEPSDYARRTGLARYIAAARDRVGPFDGFAAAALEEVRGRFTWERVIPRYRAALGLS